MNGSETRCFGGGRGPKGYARGATLLGLAWAVACKAPPPAEPDARAAPAAEAHGFARPAEPTGATPPVEPSAGPAAAALAQLGPGPVAASLDGPALASSAVSVGPGAVAYSAETLPTAEPAPERRLYRVAVLGDSLTDPRSHGGGYLRFVKSRCPKMEIDNFAQGGAMVIQMRRRFDAEVLPSPKAYTHLLLFGGVNDLYSDLTAHRTPAKIEADLGYIYERAHARGMRVVALTVAPWGGFSRYFNASRSRATQALNSWILAQANAGTVDVTVDSYALLSCGEPERLCTRFLYPFEDGLHFGRAGHELLGAALYREAFSDCE